MAGSILTVARLEIIATLMPGTCLASPYGGRSPKPTMRRPGLLAGHTSGGGGTASTVDTEPFRAALGRIACGYDGGQIIDE